MTQSPSLELVATEPTTKLKGEPTMEHVGAQVAKTSPFGEEEERLGSKTPRT